MYSHIKYIENLRLTLINSSFKYSAISRFLQTLNIFDIMSIAEYPIFHKCDIIL